MKVFFLLYFQITHVLDLVPPLGVYPRIIHFTNIEEKSGVFITGPSPTWLFLERSLVRAHPMELDGFVPCFTPFHNRKCNRGFIYFNAKGVLKICQVIAYFPIWNCYSNLLTADRQYSL